MEQETLTGKIHADNHGKGTGIRLLTIKHGFDRWEIADKHNVLRESYDHVDLTGLTCNMRGTWQRYKKGNQFVLDTFVVADVDVLKSYIASMVKGLGIGDHERLLKHFVTDEAILAVIDEPDAVRQLSEVPGFAAKKAKLLIDGCQGYKDLHPIIKLLAGSGLTLKWVEKIHKHFGVRALPVLSKSIYHLTEVPGIGFKTADRVALAKGIAPDDPHRIRHCLAYTIKQIAHSTGNTNKKIAHLTGNTIVNRGDLITAAEDELSSAKDFLHGFGYAAAAEINKLVVKGDLIPFGTDSVAAKSLYQAEERILNLVVRALSKPLQLSIGQKEVAQSISAAELRQCSPYSAAQRDAIKTATSGARIVAICGYAGTGKSTVAKTILDILETKFGDQSIICIAFAGKAADRIARTTGRKAGTIHSVLGWEGGDEDGNYWTYNYKNPLPYRVVVLDEASMVPVDLLLSVLQALADNAILILLGDDAQLPAVGAGQPFIDLLNSHLIPTVKLTQTYRQAPGSVIATFGDDIRNKRVPVAYLNPGYTDFRFTGSTFTGWKGIKDAAYERALDKYDLDLFETVRAEAAKAYRMVQDPINDLQILSPQKKGILGTINLNAELQKVLNPDCGQPSILVRNILFLQGDKVLHRANTTRQVMDLDDFIDAEGCWDDDLTKDFRVMNGNVGKIEGIEGNTIYVSYAGVGSRADFVASYKSDEVGDVLIHAFAITVHKAQGCEYQRVIIPITPSHYSMLNNRWLYTALTRGIEHCLIIGDTCNFERACKTDSRDTRRTVLAELIKRQKERSQAA